MATYTQEDFFNQLQFTYPSRSGHSKKRSADITVRIYDNTDRRTRVTITFYNGTSEKVFKTGYGLVARWKNRLVFKDDAEGFLLSKNKLKNYTSYRIQFILAENNIASYMRFIGDYELKYDELYEYYYIEAKETNA